MSDGKLSYALEGDAGSLTDAFEAARNGGDALKGSIASALESFSRGGGAAAAMVFAQGLGQNLWSAYESAQNVDRVVSQLGQSVRGLGSTELSKGFDEALASVEKLRDESGLLTKVYIGWQEIFSGFDDVRGQMEEANLDRAIEILKEQESANLRMLEVDKLRREGKGEEAELLKVQAEAEGKIFALKQQAAGADSSTLGIINTKIAQTQAYYDGLASNIKAQMAADEAEKQSKEALKKLAEERKRLEEQMAESARLAAEDRAAEAETVGELNRAIEAEYENLSKGTRAAHDMRLAQEEIALTLEAQARQREAHLTTEQKLKIYSEGVGEALVGNVDLSERMRTGVEGAAAGLKTMFDHTRELNAPTDALLKNWEKITERVGGIGGTIRTIIQVQRDHTHEVRMTRDAFDQMNALIAQRVQVTLNSMLATLRQIATEARAAGSAAAVLG